MKPFASKVVTSSFGHTLRAPSGSRTMRIGTSCSFTDAGDRFVFGQHFAIHFRCNLSPRTGRLRRSPARIAVRQSRLPLMPLGRSSGMKRRATLRGTFSGARRAGRGPKFPERSPEWFDRRTVDRRSSYSWRPRAATVRRLVARARFLRSAIGVTTLGLISRPATQLPKLSVPWDAPGGKDYQVRQQVEYMRAHCLRARAPLRLSIFPEYNHSFVGNPDASRRRSAW